jgi:hypothetical protein
MHLEPQATPMIPGISHRSKEILDWFYEYIIQLYGCIRDNLQQKTNTQIIEDLPIFIFIFHLILGSSLFSYMSQSHQ